MSPSPGRSNHSRARTGSSLHSHSAFNPSHNTPLQESLQPISSALRYASVHPHHRHDNHPLTVSQISSIIHNPFKHSSQQEQTFKVQANRKNNKQANRIARRNIQAFIAIRKNKHSSKSKSHSSSLISILILLGSWRRHWRPGGRRRGAVQGATVAG